MIEKLTSKLPKIKKHTQNTMRLINGNNISVCRSINKESSNQKEKHGIIDAQNGNYRLVDLIKNRRSFDVSIPPHDFC